MGNPDGTTPANGDWEGRNGQPETAPFFFGNNINRSNPEWTRTDDPVGLGPWNVGHLGHGTEGHEKMVRDAIVTALRNKKNLSDWFSGLMENPKDLQEAVQNVKNEWVKYNGLRDNYSNEETCDRLSLDPELEQFETIPDPNNFDRVESVGPVPCLDTAARFAANSHFVFAGSEDRQQDVESWARLQNFRAGDIVQGKSNLGENLDKVQQEIRNIQTLAYNVEEALTLVTGLSSPPVDSDGVLVRGVGEQLDQPHIAPGDRVQQEWSYRGNVQTTNKGVAERTYQPYQHLDPEDRLV